MDKNIGRKLDGRYEITELIGIGGMADVYKAIDIIDDKVVAVKILKNEFANEEEFLRRFRNESKAIAVLSHPNIVKIYDVGFTDKIQFIVMEYIDGITLKEFMEQQGVLRWKDAIHFTVQILRALQHAHDRGIVHRDIKPQNIMLFPDGTIKVMDFGIARFAREEGKTLSDKAIGSVHYISPEQARGDITDEKSDIYSVGIMMFEMLTGQKPFDADNPVTVALMHMQAKPKLPRQINDTIPEGLEEIVVRAMQKDPSKRYQSASEMIKDIEQFKRNPSIVFEYKYMIPREEDTRYFQPVGGRNERREVQKKEKDYPPKYEKYQRPEDLLADDDEDEDTKKSLFVPILGAVAAAVVIIAAFFIVTVVVTNMNGKESKTISMPNLVGMDFWKAKEQYSADFTLEAEATDYSDYQADIIYDQSEDAGKPVKQGKTIKVKVSKGIRDVVIPDVSGIDADTAVAKLENDYGLTVTKAYMVDDMTKGTVVKTEPAQGTSVPPKSAITVFISNGPELIDVKVPNFVGRTQEEVYKILETVKLTPQFKIEDSEMPQGTIIAQSILPDEVVKPNTAIVLTYSSGKIPTKKYKLEMPIPYGATGSYTFRAYIDGQEVGTASVDNVGATTNGTVSMQVEGNGTQVLSIVIQNNTTNKQAQFGKFEFNFEVGSYIQKFSPEAFQITGGMANTETETEEDDSSNPSNDDIYGD